MTYAEFQDYVAKSCMYETIYSDSEGREILIIALLDAYFMAKRAPPPWVGLEQSDMPKGESPMFDHQYFIAGMAFAAKVLEEKNK